MQYPCSDVEHFCRDCFCTAISPFPNASQMKTSFSRAHASKLLMLSFLALAFGCKSNRDSASSGSPRVLTATALNNFLPKIENFKRLQGFTFDSVAKDHRWSAAQAIYTSDSTKITMTLFDYTDRPDLAANYTPLLHGYRAVDDEGATWSESTGGFPGWLHWDADDYLGIAGVAVNDRYFLLAYGSHIPSLKALQTAAALMNLEGLKKQS